MAARSPGFSITGPEVLLMFTSSSAAMIWERDVLSQTRTAMKKDMVQGFGTPHCGRNKHLKVPLQVLLAHILRKCSGPEADFRRHLIRLKCRICNVVLPLIFRFKPGF